MVKGLRADSCLQRRHLHRRQSRLESLVPHLQPSPIDRLLQRVASQHAKGMGNSSLLRRLPDPPRNFINDNVIMRRIPAQQTSDANQSVVLPSQSQSPSRRRNLKRPRHPHNVDVPLRSSSPNQPVAGTQKQPLGNERIKAGHNNGKPLPGSIQLPRNPRNNRLRHRFDLQVGVPRGPLRPLW